MIAFNDFVNKYGLKNKATSNIKRYEVLKKIGRELKVGTYLRKGNFSTNYGIVNLHPSRETLSICFIKDCYFDSYGFPPAKKLLKDLKNRHGKCIYSEYQIQKTDIFSASDCFFIIYLTKVIGSDFKSAVLILNYQMIQ